MTNIKPKLPDYSKTMNPRIFKSNMKKSDKKYTISLSDYTKKGFLLLKTNEITYVVSKNSNNKTYFANTCKNTASQQFKDYFLNQISILISFQHPTVIHFYGFSLNDFENKPNITFLTSHYKYVLSSFLSNRSVKADIQDFQSTDRQIILIGIARLMYLLHERCIIHKRLNSDNIYINKHFHPKIFGFGSSKPEINFYSAPETILKGIYSVKTDIYSFGILMYEILSSSKAYSREKINPKTTNMLNKIAKENYRPIIDFEIKKSLKNLMTRCLSPNPDQRPASKEIFDKLCILYGDDDSESLLPPLSKYDDSSQKVSYCIDNTVNRTKVKLYIQKILVDVNSADLGTNEADIDNNEVDIDNNSDNEQKPKISGRKSSRKRVNIPKFKKKKDKKDKKDDDDDKKDKKDKDDDDKKDKDDDDKKDKDDDDDKKDKKDGKNEEDEEDGIHIRIPDSFTTIPGDLLKNREIIESIFIPNSVVMIESDAFNSCISLKIINIPESVKSIGDNVFKNCISLANIGIPDSVNYIGNGAFSKCKKLVCIKLSSSLTDINKKTFAKCYSLKSIDIPGSVLTIGKDAFSRCKQLENIKLSSSVTNIKDGAFNKCYSLKSIKVPESVSKLGKRLFYECKSLENVLLSSKIGILKEGMFSNCTSLKNIELKDDFLSDFDDDYGQQQPKKEGSLTIPSTITSIEDDAFEGCELMEEIEIPSSMKEIGNSVFKRCDNLKMIKIKSSKVTIKNDAFKGLLSVEEIESKASLNAVKIPLTVEKINGKHFHLCISCQHIIEEDDENLVHFSGFYYHKSCMKCSVCHKKIKSIYMKDFKYISAGIFLCEEHYNSMVNPEEYNKIKEEYETLGDDFKEMREEFETIKEEYETLREDYKEKIIYILMKELFDPFTNQPLDFNLNSSKNLFLEQDLIENSFRMSKDYGCFVPTVTFHFENEPKYIDFPKLISLLPQEMIITSIEEGSTILTLAIIILDDASDLKTNYQKIVDSFREKLELDIQIVGNIIGEPEFKFPDENEAIKCIKKEYNILQMMDILDKIDYKKIKRLVKKKLLKSKDKNMKFIFEHLDMYKEAEEKVRQQIKDNKKELIITGEAIIANKYYKEYEKIKNAITPDEYKGEIFLYHGTDIRNHPSIVKNNFFMPEENKKTDDKTKTDKGFFGIGIYLTENLYYASIYRGGSCRKMKSKEKTSVLCCSTIFDLNQVVEMEDMSFDGLPIPDRVKNSYGIHHAYVGSANNYQLIKEEERENSLISAEEFVFVNTYQVIPVYSFTIMKANYYILWVDENKEYSKEYEQLKREAKENVYYFNSEDECLKCVDTKILNKMKLIISCNDNDDNKWGKNIIKKIREKVHSNFVCLVFSNDINQKKSFCKEENVLFTTDAQKLINFATMRMNVDDINDFISDLEKNDDMKFNIKRKSLIKFKRIKELKDEEKEKKRNPQNTKKQKSLSFTSSSVDIEGES